MLFIAACSDASTLGKAIQTKAERCMQDKNVQGCNEKLDTCLLANCKSFDKGSSEYAGCAERCLNDVLFEESGAVPRQESSSTEEKKVIETPEKTPERTKDNEGKNTGSESGSSEIKTKEATSVVQSTQTSSDCTSDLACKRTMDDCITDKCKTLPALSQELRNCKDDCLTRALSSKKKAVLMDLEICYDGDSASGAPQASLLKKSTVRGQVAVENPLTDFPGIKAVEGGYAFTDSCASLTKVSEGYCYKTNHEKQVMAVIDLPCPRGTTCTDGACNERINDEAKMGTEQPQSFSGVTTVVPDSKNKCLTLERSQTKVGISSEKSICALRAYQKAFGISQTVGNYTCIGVYKGVPLMRDSDGKMLYGDLQSARFIGNFYWTNFEKCARRAKDVLTKDSWEEYNSGSKVPKTIQEAEACIDIVTSDLSKFEDERCLNT